MEQMQNSSHNYKPVTEKGVGSSETSLGLDSSVLSWRAVVGKECNFTGLRGHVHLELYYPRLRDHTQVTQDPRVPCPKTQSLHYGAVWASSAGPYSWGHFHLGRRGSLSLLVLGWQTGQSRCGVLTGAHEVSAEQREGWLSLQPPIPT